MTPRRQPAPELPCRAAALRRTLLGWYDRHHRDLPWRRTRDPWAILVSEVMLQQTTVAAAIPYYERFLRRWPAPAALARASREELLGEWAGLGYYRRAGHLQRAACIVAESGGALPGTRDGLARLPGVGDYTAAAVASIAHGEPVAAVDGNVERVLSRLCAIGGDPRAAATRAAIRAVAGELLHAGRPGDSNQALMELGATLCRPSSPRCTACPFAAHCRALAAGAPERYPQRAPRPAPVDVLRGAAVVRRGRAVLLRRREDSPNAGFLELPEVDAAPPRGRPAAAGSEATAERLRRRVAGALRDELLRAHGLRFDLGEPLPELRHAITRHRIRVLPWRATLLAGRVRPPLSWWQPGAEDLPLTTASRRILAQACPDLLTATRGGST